MKFLFAATLLLIAVFGSTEEQNQQTNCPVEMQEVVKEQANLKKELVENLKTVQNKIEERVCEVNNKQCEDLKTEEAKEIADVITEIVAEKIPTAEELCEQKAQIEEIYKLEAKANQTDDENERKEIEEKIEEKSDKLIMGMSGMTQEELDQAKEQAKEQQKAMEKQMKEMMENIEPMMKQLEPMMKQLEPMMGMMMGDIMQMMDGRVDVGSVPTITEIDAEGSLNRLIENLV